MNATRPARATAATGGRLVSLVDGKESGLPRVAGLGLVEAGLGLALLGAVRWLLVDRRALRIVLLSSLGGALEFYDFIIFGTFAAYISRAFFPTNDPTVSLLLTFATFGVGYVARPLGDRDAAWHAFRTDTDDKALGRRSARPAAPAK